MELSALKIVLGTFGYLAITFPLAYGWHLVAFEATYDQLGYISRNEPIIAFGFGAILLQGVLLAAIYPQLCRASSRFRRVLTFVVGLGGYHWTGHVLASAAKHHIEPLTTWFPLETAYLAIQFLLGGIWLEFVYRHDRPLPAST